MFSRALPYHPLFDRCSGKMRLEKHNNKHAYKRVRTLTLAGDIPTINSNKTAWKNWNTNLSINIKLSHSFFYNVFLPKVGEIINIFFQLQIETGSFCLNQTFWYSFVLYWFENFYDKQREMTSSVINIPACYQVCDRVIEDLFRLFTSSV